MRDIYKCIYLFGLVCVVGIFTACQDGDVYSVTGTEADAGNLTLQENPALQEEAESIGSHSAIQTDTEERMDVFDDVQQEYLDEDGASEAMGSEYTAGEHIDNVYTEDVIPEVVSVFVCGQVAVPGVYSLSAGSRICDAIELAGGCLETADINVVNQAEYVTDRMKIYIPEQGEVDSKQYMPDEQDPDGGQKTDSGKGKSLAEAEYIDVADSSKSGIINLNTATKEQLLTLPGIGDKKAEAILQYRMSHGGFKTKDELMNIAGIKEGVFNNIKAYITVE